MLSCGLCRLCKEPELSLFPPLSIPPVALVFECVLNSAATFIVSAFSSTFQYPIYSYIYSFIFSFIHLFICIFETKLCCISLAGLEIAAILLPLFIFTTQPAGGQLGLHGTVSHKRNKTRNESPTPGNPFEGSAAMHCCGDLGGRPSLGQLCGHSCCVNHAHLMSNHLTLLTMAWPIFFLMWVLFLFCVGLQGLAGQSTLALNSWSLDS